MGDKVLVAYASKAGSTGEVAEAIGQVLCEAGTTVDVRRIQEVKDLSPYRAVVLGSAVRMGKLLAEAPRFARRQRAALERVPMAYFTVCLTMKDDTAENRQTAEGYLEPLRQVKAPVSQGLFAGKLDYSKLGALMRFFLSQDKSGAMREADYRDWQAIHAWAKELVPALVG